jgi:3'-5' exoribonuclease
MKHDKEPGPKQFVQDLVPNAQVASAFVARGKSLVPFRNKPGQYLSVTLADRTGEIKGRAWDRAEELGKRFQEGDVVVVEGHVEEYQGQRQLIIRELVVAEPDSYDPAWLVVCSPRDRGEMLEELDGIIATIQNPHLRALLDVVFGDPDMRARFAAAYGAKNLHHSYVGGLLEHTLAVVRILQTTAEIHPDLDRDLMLTAGLLHDLGKLEELAGDIAVEYTDTGRFVGHTVLTDRMVCAAMDQLEGFPEDLRNLLTHALLSHHGTREWGAPVVPVTPEACALHYADNLDARVQGFKQVIAAGRQKGGQAWSDYHRSYERSLYLGRAEEEQEPSEVEPAPDQTLPL